ncbi:hypothetical protein [Cellulomonas sp. URHD0024]|uniref:hypothetical protein n=1 Tax=Cellulomonas sp. URHD0024 TaxID=1302620 RepID=UPI0012DCA73E|nr:hypothetical protein [Cellulomonas sp. URHD0024]
MTSTINGTTRPGRLRRALGRGALVSAVAIALVAGGSGAAWAWWTATATVTGTVTTASGTVPPPVNLRCTDNVPGLLLAWDPAPAAQNPVPSGATLSFLVTLKVANGATATFTVTAPATSRQVTASDLPNNGGATLSVTVQTVYTFSGPGVSSTVAGPVVGHVQGNGGSRIVRCGP